ncbi:MAG TPA: metallophosphoesterase, partial [Candidatus Sulfotelmatobacter sp.]|nr:metallophosphoesterase [Candidatus Sulfotelmatobacter sp.]
RAAVPGVGKQLLDHIQGNLFKIPAPRVSPPNWKLADIIGAQASQEFQAAGSICFHSVGDTGKGMDTAQGDVAEAMATDFDVSKPQTASPAFFFHLGDVIYGPGKDNAYRTEFYEPYVHYPGKIIAIPGNHDGETFPKTDPGTLEAFGANFVTATPAVPAIAGTIFRETMNQPAVYWWLDAPFVDIVGLYSNAAENPGFISGTIPGQAQKTWLVQTLKTIVKQRTNGPRKALILATHHPPFTAGGHSPSTQMLADIDDACSQARVMPDMHLAGHAHSYQRYTRAMNFNGRALEIPYIVAGTGGINDQAIKPATGQKTGDHTFVKSLQGYGYLLIQVKGDAHGTASSLISTMYQVQEKTRKKSQYDQVTVDLGNSTVH